MFFYDLFDGLTFTITGKVVGVSSASVRLEASTGPLRVNENFAVTNVNNEGFSVYFQFEVVPLVATPPATPQQIVKLGLSLPMEICVRDCTGGNSSTPEIFYLTGDVFAEQIVGGIAPPATRIGGLLELVGEWSEPFGKYLYHMHHI